MFTTPLDEDSESTTRRDKRSMQNDTDAESQTGERGPEIQRAENLAVSSGF